MFYNLDGLYLAGKFSVLPVKDLNVIPVYGMMCFSAVFFNCRWNATWGRRFVFFNSLTQFSASLSNITSATSHTDVIDILVNFTKFGTLN